MRPRLSSEYDAIPPDLGTDPAEIAATFERRLCEIEARWGSKEITLSPLIAEQVGTYGTWQVSEGQGDPDAPTEWFDHFYDPPREVAVAHAAAPEDVWFLIAAVRRLQAALAGRPKEDAG